MGLATRTLLEVGVSRGSAEALTGSGPHHLLAVGIGTPRVLAA
jgi:hypothetical protein